MLKKSDPLFVLETMILYEPLGEHLGITGRSQISCYKNLFWNKNYFTMKISQSTAHHITEITWVYSACPYQFGLNLCMGSLCECWTYSDFL